MKANETQVGGRHYKTKYEHWDFVLAIGMGYLAAQATRYIARWRNKSGLEDLEKAKHYVQKIKECASVGVVRSPGADTTEGYTHVLTHVRLFAAENDLRAHEHQAVLLLATWRDLDQLDNVVGIIDELIAQATPSASDSNKHAIQEERVEPPWRAGGVTPGRMSVSTSMVDTVTKDPNDCYHRALPGEPRFTLLARDPDFERLVREWAKRREGDIHCGLRPKTDRLKVNAARSLASAGAYWRKTNWSGGSGK